jgi:hypothetical protein
LQIGEAQAAARALGVEVTRLEIVRSQDITPALESLKGRAQASGLHPNEQGEGIEPNQRINPKQT